VLTVMAQQLLFVCHSSSLPIRDRDAVKQVPYCHFCCNFPQVPSRAQQLTHLAQGTEDSPYDVLVIGGGATGTGCAVDAATRSATPRP
jgi:hypothetical protein